MNIFQTNKKIENFETQQFSTDDVDYYVITMGQEDRMINIKSQFDKLKKTDSPTPIGIGMQVTGMPGTWRPSFKFDPIYVVFTAVVLFLTGIFMNGIGMTVHSRIDPTTGRLVFWKDEYWATLGDKFMLASF